MTDLHGETLTWRHRGPVLEVELHKEPLNTLGEATLRELELLVRHLEAPPLPVRAVLLYSSLPGGFCAGADLAGLQAGLAERRDRRHALSERLGAAAPVARRVLDRLDKPLVRRRLRGFIQRIHGVFDALDRAPVPVIGALHGVVFGGGLELALVCDLLVADKTTRLAFPELRLGIVPGFGGLPRLEREVGNAMVRDLLLTGRTLRAQRAQEVGLIHQVVARGEHLRTARRLAAQVAEHDPEVVARAKAFAKPLPRRRLRQERALFTRMIAEPRVGEALDDFVQRTDVRPYLR